MSQSASKYLKAG